MKKLLFALLFIAANALSANAQNDAIVKFFQKHYEDERFTVVYVSPKMFSMIAKIETDDEEWQSVREVIKELGGLRILTSDSIDNGMELYQDALSRIPQPEYEELLTVRDGQEHVRFWIKESGDVITELLLLVSEPTSFTMLSFTGRIDLAKISKLANKLDVEGVEHLDKVGKKPDESTGGN
jgi:Domain of unknown function (DUF4252)